MPLRRKMRKPVRKIRRVFRRRRGYFGKKAINSPLKTSVVTIGKEMPDRCRVVLKYADTYSFTTLSAPPSQTWKINSLFDPDLTGTGHQPQGFDQWSAFYQTYQVYGTKLDLEIVNDGTAATMCVLAISDTNSSSYSVNDSLELKWSKHCVVGGSAGTNKGRLTMYMSTKKIHGFRSIDQLEATSANITGDPNDLSFAWFKCATMDASTAAKIFVRATLTFYCVFSEQKNPAES